MILMKRLQFSSKANVTDRVAAHESGGKVGGRTLSKYLFAHPVCCPETAKQFIVTTSDLEGLQSITSGAFACFRPDLPMPDDWMSNLVM
jgi:hypothetical protein